MIITSLVAKSLKKLFYVAFFNEVEVVNILIRFKSLCEEYAWRYTEYVSNIHRQFCVWILIFFIGVVVLLTY